MKRILLLTLSLLLIAGLAVNCSDRGSSTMSSEVASELANLPSDVRGVAYMNMDRLRNSPMFSSIKDSMEKRLDDASDYQEMLEETGLDVRSDVNEILVAFTNPDGDMEQSGLVVAKGNYDPERIMNFVKKKDTEGRLNSEKYKDYTLYIPTNDDKRFCFADKHRIVAGEKELVMEWLDNFSDKSTSFKNAALNNAISNLRFKDTFWAVLDAASMMDEMMAQMSDEAMNRMPAIKSIQEVHMSMDVSENLKVDGRGHFDNSENALLFHDALKGMMAMVKLSMGSDRDAMDVINKIDVQQQESDVQFFMEMTRADIDKLMEKRNKGFALN